MPLSTRTLLLGLAALVQAGCCSVSYGVAGYERHGVWLPGGRWPDGRWEAYRPQKRITVQGLELLFDEALRLYRVVGRPGHFYCAGRFYRRSGPDWETARTIEGRWTRLAPTETPPTLVAWEPPSG